jgi:hypothetical protein
LAKAGPGPATASTNGPQRDKVLKMLDKPRPVRNHGGLVRNGWGGPMQMGKLVLLAALGIAALGAPTAAAGSSNFQIRVGDITGEGGKLDKKSGQQWIPIISWEWGEYVAANGAPKVNAKLNPQGFYDTGSILVNGRFTGCQPGKSIGEAVLKTPGVRYTFTDVVITDCDETDMTFNYGKIRSSAAW